MDSVNLTSVLNSTSLDTSLAHVKFMSDTYYVLIIVRVVACVGIPGNLLAFTTICRMKASSPASFLVAFLALADTLALITKLVTYEVTIGHSLIFCMLNLVPMSISTAVTNWTIVLICVERYISVHYPLHKRSILTRRRMRIYALTLTVALTVFISALNAALRRYDPQTGSCTILNTVLFHLLSDGLEKFAPFLVITAFTIAVIRKLYKEKRIRTQTLQERRGTNTSGTLITPNQASINVEKTMSMLMIIAVVLYFILNAPLSVYVFLIAPYIQQQQFEARLVMTLYVLKDISHALNTFVYFFLCKGFRKQCFQLCTKRQNK